MTTAPIHRREALDGIADRFLTGDASPATTREQDSTPLPATDPAPAPVPTTQAGDPGDALALREHLGNLTEQVAALAARGPVGDTHDPHPLAQFRTFADYVTAVYAGDADPDLLTRAWADQVPADNPGVMPPSWAGEVRGIVDLGRRMIQGTGGPASAGTTGMTLEWPTLDPTTVLTSLIGEQSAPKTEVTSVKVKITKGSADLRTFAGGSDIALQVIERSAPSYLDAYLRIMAAAYAAVTDAAFCADLVAADKTPGTLDVSSGAKFTEQVIQACLDVEAATGQPPSVIGVGRDLFASIASLSDKQDRPLFPALGASNSDGTVGRAGLSLDVLGIPAVPVAGAAGKVIITNGVAARWAEDGPRTIAAADVPKLGRDVAVYGYADTAVYAPAGVVVLSKTAPSAAPPAK